MPWSAEGVLRRLAIVAAMGMTPQSLFEAKQAMRWTQHMYQEGDGGVSLINGLAATGSGPEERELERELDRQPIPVHDQDLMDEGAVSPSQGDEASHPLGGEEMPHQEPTSEDPRWPTVEGATDPEELEGASALIAMIGGVVRPSLSVHQWPLSLSPCPEQPGCHPECNWKHLQRHLLLRATTSCKETIELLGCGRPCNPQSKTSCMCITECIIP